MVKGCYFYIIIINKLFIIWCDLHFFYINAVKIYRTLLTIKMYKTIMQGAWKCIATLQLLCIKILTHINTKKEIITIMISNRELQTKEKLSQ